MPNDHRLERWLQKSIVHTRFDRIAADNELLRARRATVVELIDDPRTVDLDSIRDVHDLELRQLEVLAASICPDTPDTTTEPIRSIPMKQPDQKKKATDNRRSKQPAKHTVGTKKKAAAKKAKLRAADKKPVAAAEQDG